MTESKGQDWTPYDAELTNAARSVGMSKEERDTIEGLLLKREGYLRAMQDMTPLRESYKTLLEAAYIARERFSELNGKVSKGVWDGNYQAIHALDEALAQAEALKGIL